MTNYLINYRRTRTPGYIAGVQPIASFTPTSISGLSLWLDASQDSFSDSEVVTTWLDRSGNSYDATQADAGLKPTYYTNIKNGKPALLFASDGDWLEVDTGLSIGNATDFTILIVYNCLGSYGPGRRVIDGHGNNWLMGPHTSIHRYYNGAFIEDGAATNSDFKCMIVTQTASGSSLRVNGSSIGTNANTTAPINLGIGAASEPIAGYVPEIIVYNATALTPTNISQLESYINSKYAIW